MMCQFAYFQLMNALQTNLPAVGRALFHSRFFMIYHRFWYIDKILSLFRVPVYIFSFLLRSCNYSSKYIKQLLILNQASYESIYFGSLFAPIF